MTYTYYTPKYIIDYYKNKKMPIEGGSGLSLGFLKIAIDDCLPEVLANPPYGKK